ncbi:MAG: 50S ribosomal protein L11 methyltransferase [Ignavibacteria bacterium]|nr:50S ribosomal protein L11 methyltransferase [Ignavibacteria bacterium]
MKFLLMVPKKFINLHLSIPEEQFDLAYYALEKYPLIGVEECLDELIISFNQLDYSHELRDSVIAELTHSTIPVNVIKEDVIEDKNWNSEWEQSLAPVIVSERVAITPECKLKDVTQELTIIINPKMSFGTGYHPTTRMVCRLLEQNVTPNSTWIDAGMGTGVLAILAAKLGAQSVFAFDNDEWSVDNAQENIEVNKVVEVVKSSKADVFTVELPESDGICANLYRNLLIPNFPKLLSSLTKSHGCLIVSGILKYDIDEIIEAAETTGFIHQETIIENEWAAIRFSA